MKLIFCLLRIKYCDPKKCLPCQEAAERLVMQEQLAKEAEILGELERISPPQP